jgi:hypothetical protein
LSYPTSSKRGEREFGFPFPPKIKEKQ